MKKTAFTLIELLVVIAVIALLITLLLPVLESVRFEARIAACASNVNQILIASTNYAVDNRNYFPEDDHEGMRKQSSAGFAPALGSYIGGSVSWRDNEVFRCPQVTYEDDMARVND